MIESTGLAMAADIESAVRSVPGVTAVFRSGGMISKVMESGAQLLGTQQVSAPLVRWESSQDGPRVVVAIGVGAASGAAATTCRVHEVIVDLCAARGVTPSDVHVTVVHIDEDHEFAPDSLLTNESR